MHGRVERAPEKVVPWWQRFVGLHRQGRLIIFEEVDWPAARESFDMFLESPKEFAIETVEGVRIDFSAKHGSDDVGLDTWFSDSDISEALVSKAVARELLRKIFHGASDAEMAAYIRGDGRVGG